MSGVSILNKADELARVIQAITELTHVKDVVVVAHSMGGLDGRAYLENLAVPYSEAVCTDQSSPQYVACSHAAKTKFTQDVAKFITLDTPHASAITASLPLFVGGLFSNCADTLNRRELVEGSWVGRSLNINAPNPPPGVTIAAIQSYTSPWVPGGTDDGDGVVLRREQSIRNIAPNVAATTYYDIPKLLWII